MMSYRHVTSLHLRGEELTVRNEQKHCPVGVGSGGMGMGWGYGGGVPLAAMRKNERNTLRHPPH